MSNRLRITTAVRGELRVGSKVHRYDFAAGQSVSREDIPPALAAKLLKTRVAVEEGAPVRRRRTRES